MRLDRRQLLAMLPALALVGRAAAQSPGSLAPDQSALQPQLAPFWDQLAMLPAIRQPALESPSAGICYM
ncbi:MAG: permease, partial [Sphingomonadales bacterium]